MRKHDDLNDILSRWGSYHAARYDQRGYASRSILNCLVEPFYFNPGSRVLVKSQPAWIWAIDTIVAKLDEPYRNALKAKYCLPPVDGRLLSERQLAALLHISRGAYRQRIYRARKFVFGRLESY